MRTRGGRFTTKKRSISVRSKKCSKHGQKENNRRATCAMKKPKPELIRQAAMIVAARAAARREESDAEEVSKPGPAPKEQPNQEILDEFSEEEDSLSDASEVQALSTVFPSYSEAYAPQKRPCKAILQYYRKVEDSDAKSPGDEGTSGRAAPPMTGPKKGVGGQESSVSKVKPAEEVDIDEEIEELEKRRGRANVAISEGRRSPTKRNLVKKGSNEDDTPRVKIAKAAAEKMNDINTISLIFASYVKTQAELDMQRAKLVWKLERFRARYGDEAAKSLNMGSLIELGGSACTSRVITRAQRRSR